MRVNRVSPPRKTKIQPQSVANGLAMSSILTALDNGKICIVTLLDLSAAFDTIDQNILLHRLEHTFGISDSALSWFRSYLSDRTQIVTVNSLRSDEAPLS